MEKILIDDVAKLDLRVGEIKSAEEHPNANKLLVLKVDLGEEEDRTIVAGLKNYYSVDELVGKKAIFVVNLKPVDLRGVESNGMILAASNDGKEIVKILSVDGGLEVGSKVS